MKVSFKVKQCNGEGTWYTKDAEDYSTTSSITFKYEGKDDTKLVRAIAELKEKLATSEKDKKRITQDHQDDTTKMSALVNAAESEATKKVVSSIPKSKMKRAKKQSTILDSENPYLKKRAENILKLSKKVQQLQPKKNNKAPSPESKEKK